MHDRLALSKRYEQFKTADRATIPSPKAGYFDFEAVRYDPSLPYIRGNVYEDKRKQVTYADRVELIRISNHVELSFSEYTELIRCFPRYAIAGGMRPRPATSKPKVNKNFQITFKKWAENRYADVEGVMNFYDYQKWVASRVPAEGDVYVLLTKTADGYPQLSRISPLRVRSSLDESDDSIDGIYYSKSGAVTAYNVFDLEDPGDGKFISNKKSSYTMVPAENMIWVSKEEQGHGIPWGQSAFPIIRNLKNVFETVSNAVVNANTFTLEYHDSTGKGGPPIIDGMGGVIAKNTPPAPKGTQNPVNDQRGNTLHDPSYLEKFVAGTKNKIVNVGYGELRPVNAAIPNIDSYVETALRSICLSMGIAYEFVYCPEKLNNKGGDIIIDKVRATFREVQEMINSRFNQRVYNWVISVLGDDEDFLELGDETPYTCQWTPPAKVGVGRNDVTNRIDSIQNHLWNPYLDADEIGKDADQIMDGQIKWMKRWFEQCKAEGVDPNSMVFGKASTFKPLATKNSVTTTTEGNTVTVETEPELEDGNDTDEADPTDFDGDNNEDIDNNSTDSEEQ